jgi:hypothetical protein
MSRKQGFPLSQRFNQYHWNKWDNLSSQEREDYEKQYESRDDKITKRERDEA